MNFELGELYVIKNTVNTLVYVGITYCGVENRWKDHLSQVKNGTPKLYKAMRKLGVEHFYIEKIAEYRTTELEQKEVEYIKLYNSFKNGYNSTSGSNSGVRLIINEDELVSDYKSGIIYNELMVKYKCSVPKILTVLNRHNVKLGTRKISIIHQVKPKKIVMYDKQFNPIGQFSSICKAYKWAQKFSPTDIDQRNFYTRVTQAAQTGCVAYGQRWQFEIDLYYKNENNTIVFRTLFDKEAYIQGGEITFDGKVAICSNKTVAKIIETENDNMMKSAICPKCENIKDRNSNVCQTCSNEGKRLKLSDKEIEELKYLVTYNSLEAVGRKFGVTGSAIKKRCKRNGIEINRENRYPIKEELEELINKYTNAEIMKITGMAMYDLRCALAKYSITRGGTEKPVDMLNKIDGSLIRNFKSCREAAKFIIEVGISKGTLGSVESKIPYSIKMNGTAFKYRWRYS